jgi:hypothetical protein
MKDLPIRYRDTRRVDIHVRMPLELYVIQRDRYLSDIQRSLLLNMLLDSGSKLFSRLEWEPSGFCSASQITVMLLKVAERVRCVPPRKFLRP